MKKNRDNELINSDDSPWFQEMERKYNKKNKLTKVTVDLPANVMSALEDIVKLKKITMTQAITDSILTYNLLQSEKQKGFKILIEKPFKRFFQVMV